MTKVGVFIIVLVVFVVVIGGFFLFKSPSEPEQQRVSVVLDDDSQQGIAKSTSLIEPPSTATSGQAVVFSWRVNAPADSQITHTAIHYSTESQPGIFRLDVTPPNSGYSELTTEYASGNFNEGIFQTTLTVTETTYFRAHSIIDGDNYWTEEFMIEITSGNGLTGGAVKEFTIGESNFKLNPSIITVNEGDTVKITVVNEGGTHNLFIEDYNERTDIVSSGSRVLEFVADKAGTFNMWCEVSGHRSLGMEGQFIVQ